MSEYGILTQTQLGSTWANSGENGWKFTIGSNDIKVSGFRVKVPKSESVVCRLWDVATDTLLATTTIVSISGAWAEAMISPSVTLSAGKSYIVSAVVTSLYYYNGATSKTTFNSKLNYVTAVNRRPATSSMPTDTESDYLYPHVDIIIGGSEYKASGNAIFTATGITATVATSSINWAESKPPGTTLTVSVSTDGTNYSAVTKGGTLLAAGTVLDNATIHIKVEMATTDATVTPTLSNLAISLQSAEDRYSIILEMEPLQRFESAAGNISVAYAGGSIMGEGGPVAAFTQTFSPSDLAYKGDQNDAEHIEMSASAVGTLTRIYYTNTAAQDMGHIEMSVTATGTLTNVSDI